MTTLTKTEIRKRWKQIEAKPLLSGAHLPDGKMCVMEAVAFVAGEDWSDSPQCASPVIAAFLRSWNDGLDTETRQMLKPYVLKVVGTRGTAKQEEKRAWMAADWLARECAPAFLRLAGLTDHAEALEGLAALTTTKRAEKAQPQLAAARDAARDAAGAAAGDAARDAAWAAARDAAGTAAWAAAWDAARDAARDAAGTAAGTAAWAAAWAAAGTAAWAAPRKRLAPTVSALQTSALALLDRMIEVTA